MTVTEKPQTTIVREVGLDEDITPRFEVKPLIPKGFTTEATTPLEALLMAQAALQVEGRWVKNSWFQNPGQDEDYDDPFCDSWQACAAGMVALVTVGAGRQCTVVRPKFEESILKGKIEELLPTQLQSWSLSDRLTVNGKSIAPKEKTDLYDKAVEFLRRGAGQVEWERYGVPRKRNWSDVPSFNDSGAVSREDVLQAFSHGIALAAAAEVEEAIAKRMVAAMDAALPNHHVTAGAF